MKRICMNCGCEFTLLPAHIGYATLCPRCNKNTDVERVGAEIHWEGKHTPVIEIVALSRALRFNKRSKRFGTSVLKVLAPQPPNPYTGSEGDRPAREPHDNNPGTEYRSPLGEWHHTKR